MKPIFVANKSLGCMLLSFLFFCAVLLVVPSSYAVEESPLKLDIPSVMFAGESYFGTIISKDAGLVLLSSSNAAIANVDPSVYVDSFGHETFKITPQDKGPVVINAHMGDIHIESKSEVFFPIASRNSLELILPSNSTTFPKVTGYVYLLESNLPSIASEDVEILVSSIGSVQHKESYVIRAGQTGMSFDIELEGDAEITTSATGYLPDTESISLVPQNVRVVLEFAPWIVAPNSLGYGVISLAENDEHFIPTRSHPITIRSSNPDVISVRPGGAVSNLDLSENVYFDSDGLAMIALYSKNPGIAEISASVDGFGTSTISVHVVASENLNIVNASKTVSNVILTSMLPTINSGNGYLFAGMYFVENESSVSSGSVTSMIQYQDDSIADLTISVTDVNNAYISGSDVMSDDDSFVSESEYSRAIFPQIHTSNSLSVTSNGAIHDSLITIAEDGLPSNVGWTKIRAPTGQYEVSIVSSTAELSTREVNFGKSSFESYDVKLVPLPVLVGFEQDVAAVIVQNGEQSMVNPNLLGRDLTLIATSIGLTFEDDILKWPAGRTAAVISASVASGGDLNISLSGIGSDTGMIYLSNVLSESNSVLINVPDFTYAAEVFAAYGFILNADGIPVHRIIPDATGQCVALDTSYLYKCNGAGSIIHSSSAGIDENQINPVLKPFDDLELNLPDVLHVDSSYPILISGLSDTAKITIDTEIPTQIKDGGVIYLVPEKTGEFNLLVYVSDIGFSSAQIEQIVHVNDDVQFEITATNGDGGVSIVVHYDGGDFFDADIGNFTISKSGNTTPFSFLAPRGEMIFDFPDIVRTDTKNLKFVKVAVDGTTAVGTPFSITTDDKNVYGSIVKIHATYEPKLVLTVNDLFGPAKTLPFSEGDTVVLKSPASQPKYAGLIHDKFVQWNTDSFASPEIIYHPDGSASFVIDQHLTLVASYEDDMTIATIVAGVAVAFVFISVMKRNSKFLLLILVDKLRSNDDEFELDDDEDDSGPFEEKSDLDDSLTFDDETDDETDDDHDIDKKTSILDVFKKFTKLTR